MKRQQRDITEQQGSIPGDRRHIEAGLVIPAESYCDQPYTVVNADGSWTCVMTTGPGREGERGQHVVALISADRGRRWDGPYDIEPSEGPEASWAMPLLVPGTGRIYAFYTFNAENRREVKTIDGGVFTRVDSLGVYAYRYSDDRGRTWSRKRYEIPMRLFACDRENAYGGRVLFFWGVGKPFIHDGAAWVCACKVGGFGPGFFTANEGVLFRSPNLPSESDPARHRWDTLPEGETGVRPPAGGGPIAGEFNVTPMNDGSLYGTFRTIAGWSGHAYSRDGGRRWEVEWMTCTPGGRRVKNPRCANFVRRLDGGRYIYWFSFHGGEVLGRAAAADPAAGYANRNPVWLCAGEERDGRIHWSQPEIILYDDKIGNRMSYPDFIEDDGRLYFTETQKETARVHELDPRILEALLGQGKTRRTVSEGLLLDLGADACAAGSEVAMPALPPLHDPAPARLNPATGAATPGAGAAREARGGFSLELWLRFADLAPWQVLFDSRDEEGGGLLVQLTDRGTVRLQVAGRAWDSPGSRTGNGLLESACESDAGLLRAGARHQVLFIVDGGPRIMTVMVDGALCDGGRERQFGWSRFHPGLLLPATPGQARPAGGLRGRLERVRLYGRALLTSEGVANYLAGTTAVNAGENDV